MKYIGSKSKIAKEIIPILQGYIQENNIKYYVEPFVGGFNVIDKIQCEHRIANDIDPIVCELVKSCRENPSLLDELQMPTKEEYYDVRDNPNKYLTWYRAAILLFASYNARVYGGCYGATATTKDGKVRNYFNEALNNFRKQLPLLSNIDVSNVDYRELEIPKKKTLIYCDPPYSEGIGYCNKFNTTEFWEWCREQSKAGHIVIISEYTAPEDFRCIWKREIKSHLNNRNKLEKTEKLWRQQ